MVDESRYGRMKYRRCGRSGVLLPAISLGLWHNFGHDANFENARTMVLRAFDLGITHFDLANNYGPPPGSAEENFGKILQSELLPHRDELIISTKAGYGMWPGPYGEWGSRKHLIASLNQSLKRLSVEYVDIFYSHRPDPNTPLEETMMALDYAVRSGKALYVGISNYGAQQTADAIAILRRLGTPCLVHQPRYSLLAREPEQGLFQVLRTEGVGAIAYSPLAQGLLTDRYISGIPAGSRASLNGFLKASEVTHRTKQVQQLRAIAEQRSQTLAQMSLAWVLRDSVVSSVIIGASGREQLNENVKALGNTQFEPEELQRINEIVESAG